MSETLIELRKMCIRDRVSSQARELLSFKDDESFSDKLNEFDNYLYENKLNPGTTADLTAASIFVSYLESNF